MAAPLPPAAAAVPTTSASTSTTTPSLLQDDDENEELLQTLKSELHQVIKDEARVEAELTEGLDSLLRLEASKHLPAPDGKHMALQLEGLEKGLLPRMEGLNLQVQGLSEHVYSCQELADKMSCTVRKLDERQMRVQRVLALVEDIINLKTCAEGVARALEEGDLPDATSYVRQFHSIEGAAAKASEHYDFMVASENKLKETVMRKVQLAVSKSNLEDVFKFCPLLGPLGLAEEGAKIYESFAERLLKEGLDPLAGDNKTQAVQLLPKIYNTAAGFLHHHLPLVAHGFKQVEADVSLIRLVQRECEDAAIPIIRKFIKARGLREKCRVVERRSANASPTQGSVYSSDGEGGNERERERRRLGSRGGGYGLEEDEDDALLPSGELDGLMDELALVIQHTESYDRFVRFLAAEAKKTSKEPEKMVVLPLATDLNGAIAEVSGPFTVLEDHLMRTSISKALAIDEIPPMSPMAFPQRGGHSAAAAAAGRGGVGDGDDSLSLSTSSGGFPQTSSCVDDSFYVVRRCARRALVTGHAGTASAIVNYINSTLLDELLSILSSRLSTLKELPLPIGISSASGAGNASGVGVGVNVGVLQSVAKPWSKVKDHLEAGLETAQHLTAVAGSLIGGGAGSNITYFSEGEAKQALDKLVNLNNLGACAHYTVKLQQELVAEVPSIFQDDPSTQQLMACLQDLSATSKHFQQAVEEGLHHLSSLIKPKLRTYLHESLGKEESADIQQQQQQQQQGGGGGSLAVSFDLDEDDFAANEAADPFAHRFVEYLSGILGPVSQRLSDGSYDLLQQSVADYLSKRLEHLLMKKAFTQLGALQLDKDLRCILAFFPSKMKEMGGMGGGSGGGGHRGIRDRFSRLMQINQLLNLDSPLDAAEEGGLILFGGGGHGGGGHHGHGGAGNKLTLEEAVAVLRLRVDWEEAEIEKAHKMMLTGDF